VVRRSFEVGRSRALGWVAVVSACAAGACAAAEGLDQYQLCETDCDGGVDASLPPVDAAPDTAPAPDGQGQAPDGAGGVDQGSPPPSDGGSGEAGDSATPRDGGGADASCACIPAAPSGWTGYVQIVVTDGGAPRCVAPYDHAQAPKKASPSGAPAQCTPCTCAPPPSGPIQCQVSLGSGGLLCAGEAMTVAPAGVCVVPPGPVGTTSGPNGDSYGPTMVPAPTGSCAPDGGRLVQPPGAPQSAVVGVCATTAGQGATCPSLGDICVPAPGAPGGSPAGVCIYQAGAQTCPPGRYTVQVVAAGAVLDTRGCGACACAPPACPGDGYVEGYASLNCSGSPAATFDASTACVLGNNANGSVSFKYSPSHAPWTGTCAVSAGGPTGGVALDTSATTFCCMP
jgi:hypothetical protein